ncbi:DUF4349 domain-containing protein [Simiduia curdlanivorans]|uniref:DUF4349 domain-containing protein n=1 Tax=Simiduia curdlanivorans TaxID=1492769 RepID=A0ABV8V064_9GAMM|nr:DUF4349 domain-containing protein [Simiduia curdlanivorans]MDN3637890.1 DUF4349 domain-containing protein [Simiduia curdlanivorans]
MRLRHFASLIIIAAIATGCSKSDSPEAEHFRSNDAVMAIAPKQQQARGQYLAYEHSATVELAEAKIPPAFNALVEHCQKFSQSCTMMHSELQGGEYANGYLRFRVAPADVDKMFELVSKYGEVTRQSTNVDDLQDAIVDGGKRIELLQAYQQRLLALEAQASKDIESLIKVASELSRVQSDLEYALGEKAKLLQRVNQDIVSIQLTKLTNTGFWAPIFESASDFGDNFSDAIATMITALAYIFPWLILLLLSLMLTTFAWRKLKRK